MPVDPKTLATDPDKGIRIRPKHLHLALRELAGIEKHRFAEQFPLQVPDAERLQGLWGQGANGRKRRSGGNRRPAPA